MQISTVNRPSTSLKGPVKDPQKEQCGPTPHPAAATEPDHYLRPSKGRWG
jgi:hypothetical protein